MNDVIQKANWRDRLLYFLGRRKAFIISGDSMTPTLADGDKVLVDEKAVIAVGDIVIANHPYRSGVKVVKRVSHIADHGRLTLVGDNRSASTDSQSFGTVSSDSVIGNVVNRVK